MKEETRKKLSEVHKSLNKIGNKSHSWKGGITPIWKMIRNSNKYNEWRLEIFKRDNFTCQKCNQIGGRLEAHHIKAFSKLFREARKYMPLFNPYDAAMLYDPLWDINNGKTLCQKCHDK